MDSTAYQNHVDSHEKNSVYDAFNNISKIESNTKFELKPSNDEITHQDVEMDSTQLLVGDVVRCAVGVFLYAIGLFLVAWGQILQPSLLLLLAGISTIILGGKLFLYADHETTEELKANDEVAKQQSVAASAASVTATEKTAARNDVRTSNIKVVSDKVSVNPLIAVKNVEAKASPTNIQFTVRM